MSKTYNPVWDLDSAFPGGTSSPQFAAELESLNREIPAMKQSFAALAASDTAALAKGINEAQALAERIMTCSAFSYCLVSANTEDKDALLNAGKTNLLWAQFNDILVMMGKKLSEMSDETWQSFIALPELQDIVFGLTERRRQAKELLPIEQEMLINALSVNGYEEWGSLYDRIVAQVKISSADAEGTVSELSAGQALNRLSDADAGVRNELLKSWESAWQALSDLGALELNALVGYRLSLYKARGWDDFMKEPLEMNRMTAATLDAMWSTISANKAKLVAYLRRKKELLGVEQLSWADFGAPLSLSGKGKTYSYGEAAEFVIEQFGAFSPKMAAYAEEAIDKRWVEAENRPHKGIGAYCTGFASKNEERVFMTFDGTIGSVSTLAHELGHAFHSRAMQGLPMLAQDIGMSVAETASTFAEIVVANASLAQAQDDWEKLSLLEDKINRAASMMMNIHARFIFETNFTRERMSRQISAPEINEMMLAAQKEAYENALDIWHPTFWLSKGHFHGTGVPFYNYPYTFGFLFANGIYAQALKSEGNFEDRYIELLRHTGSMEVEELAKKFLDADLSQADFWQDAIDVALADFDEFMALSEKYLAQKS